MEKCVGVEWELEEICDISLLTNQVIKVVHSQGFIHVLNLLQNSGT